MRNIIAGFNSTNFIRTADERLPTGAFKYNTNASTASLSSYIGIGITGIDASLVVPVANDNRPQNTSTNVYRRVA